MPSSEQSSQEQQQQNKVGKKPPFADWPTIKILSPPQGECLLVADLKMYH